ncbi:NifU family protein [bacterium]|nr:NifU family protein [bacterium]
MREAVEKVLNEEVRPMLEIHGGGVELVDVTDDGIVKVKLQGACGCCPSAQMTLKGVVEAALKAKVPGVKGVEAV